MRYCWPVCAVLVSALLAGPRGASPDDGPESSATPARVPPTRADDDLRRIRDIFRFGGDSPARKLKGADEAVVPGAVRPEEEPASPSAARLVGLVRRSGRLVAVLAIEGDVVLLEAGQTAGDVTVLQVTGETVRLAVSGGDEMTLRLP